MKESVGILSLTNIVILFILVFTGYLCITLNQTKAYNVKNQIISIIQKYNGIDSNAVIEIQKYMSEVGYRSSGRCNSEEASSITNYAITQRDGLAVNGTSGMICIAKHSVNDKMPDPNGQFPKAAYYDIKVFFALDMPIINNVFNFNLKGSTRIIYCPKEDGGNCR